MTQRAHEIEQQYEWLETNFPETGKRIIITSLGVGETIEDAAKANIERLKEAVPSLAEQDGDKLLHDHMQFMSTNLGKLSSTHVTGDGVAIEYLQIPTSLSLFLPLKINTQIYLIS